MCLVDDGTGTGTKVAQYSIDTDGNYNELYTYVLYSPAAAYSRPQRFTLKVTLGQPGKPQRRRRPHPRRPTASTRRTWSPRSTRSPT